MPRGDATGPRGMGPMTGRAAGFCAGNVNPGYGSYQTGRGFGGGWGRGDYRGGGRGRGFGWGYPNAYPYPVAGDETYRINSLEQQASYLEESLEAIRRELKVAKERKGED